VLVDVKGLRTPVLDEATRELRNLHSELHNFCSSPDSKPTKVACSKHKTRNSYRLLDRKPKERDNLRDLSVEGRTIKINIRKSGREVGGDYWEQGSMKGFCEHGNEHSDSIKADFSDSRANINCVESP
jgi:hypothetical protein